MKKTLILTLALFTLLLSSCGELKVKPKTFYTNFGQLLTDCEGYAVLVTMEDNEGSYKSSRFSYTIKDSTGICRTFSGGKMEINKGDTLLKKN